MRVAKTPLIQRVARGLRWALLGRPARRGIGALTVPRRLFIEASVTSAPLVPDSRGDLVAWVRMDLVQLHFGSLGRVGYELGQMVHANWDPHKEKAYETISSIVRGTSLTLETAHGEALTLREGSFTSVPRPRPPVPLMSLPSELRGEWPGRDADQPLAREARIRRGDVIRFEALFTPERHPRPGSSYRDDVEVRYRVDGGRSPIELFLLAPEDR